MTLPEESSTTSQPAKTDTYSGTVYERYTRGSELFGLPTYFPQTKLPEASTVDDHYYDESSTSKQLVLRSLTEKMNNIFIRAKDQIFEDGMCSEFSEELTELISIYGHIVMDIISRIVLSEQTNLEVVSETMRIIGRVKDLMTFRDRLWLLERGLLSSSARVRDGAIIGLSYLDNPISIPPLKVAVEREKIQELKEDMQQVLSQLEDTKSNVSDKENQEN